MKIIIDRDRFCMRVSAVALLLMAVDPGVSGSAGAATVDDFVARTYSSTDGVLPYRLFIPTNYNASLRYPLVLFLHGSGSRGNDNRLQLAGEGGPLVFVSDEIQRKYPSFMVAPQCPADGDWTFSSTRSLVIGMISALKREFSIDASRVYITGLSMGGFGTWDYCAQPGSQFGAAIPMSAGGNLSTASALTKMSIWNFHAADDNVVPVADSRYMIDAVRLAGGSPIYTEYAQGGHGIWTAAYNTPILMDWVFAQRRGTNSTVPPLLTITDPTNQPTYASSTATLTLRGSASDGGTGPASVTWTNYLNQAIAGSGAADGTTNWAMTDLPLDTTAKNLIIVTGQGTSWYSYLGGSTTFNDVLTVSLPPFITGQPRSLTVTENESASFSVAVNADAPSPQFQWRWQGKDISGATTSSFTLTNAQLADAGNYTVVVGNQFGKVLSATARLTVLPMPTNNAPPVAGNLSAATKQDLSITIPNDQFLQRASDPDGDPLSLSAVTGTSTNGGSAILGATVVTYTPPAGFIGLDGFAYTVSDGRGGTGSGWVFVEVRSSDQVYGHMFAPRPSLQGGVEIEFAGLPGYTYLFQRAEAISGPWTNLPAVTVNSYGIGSCADTQPPPKSAFYRTVYP